MPKSMRHAQVLWQKKSKGLLAADPRDTGELPTAQRPGSPDISKGIDYVGESP